MKLSKKQIHQIRDHASTFMQDMPIQLRWDINSEVNQEERITIAWLKAVSMVCGLGLDVECKKDLGYEKYNTEM